MSLELFEGLNEWQFFQQKVVHLCPTLLASDRHEY